VVDFHTAEAQSQRLPIADHLLNLCRHLILIQRLELTIEANHRNQWPPVSLEQCRINSCTTPASLGKACSASTVKWKVCAAVPQCDVVVGCPLSLPDVELLIEWRSVLPFATTEQGERRQQEDPASQKNHESAYP
jgi:hypothetical protein